MERAAIHYIRLEGWPIYKQLQLEEALLRADNRNWCLINQGSEASIVMGISGKEELLIDETHHQRHPVPIIRRFSGGGTVYVDHNTLFVTFICNSEEFQVPCFPKEVMRWTEKVYRPVFEGKDFHLRENDYVIGDRKFGGNAQYLQKKRWLHHSTLLWDYEAEKMNLLKLPPKMPEYRKTRPHQEFLCSLKGHFDSCDEIVEGILKSLSQKHAIHLVDQVESFFDLPHRKATVLVKKIC
jgi:lipoate-protein ligase A